MPTMRYVTTKEMQELDRAAIEDRGIPAAQLMEAAGKAVAEQAMAMSRGGPVTVFCGYGNNGGDGFVVARLLAGAGYAVRTFLVGSPRTQTPETAENAERLARMGHPPEMVMTEEGLGEARDAAAESILIIDALFGIGVRGRLDDIYVRLIEAINASGRPVIAVDVPSGLHADTGMPLPVAVRATKTVTMGYPKAGFLVPGAAAYIGELIVADIGI